MATEFWMGNEEVHNLMKELITLYHPDLVPIVDEISIVFREVAQNKGGTPVFGTAQKASPVMSVLAKRSLRFVLYIASDCWSSLNGDQRKALIDSLLLRCSCEFDQKKQEYKCTLRSPDIIAFREEIDRHGMWWPNEDPRNKEGTQVLDKSPELGQKLKEHFNSEDPDLDDGLQGF